MLLRLWRLAGCEAGVWMCAPVVPPGRSSPGASKGGAPMPQPLRHRVEAAEPSLDTSEAGFHRWAFSLPRKFLSSATALGSFFRTCVDAPDVDAAARLRAGFPGRLAVVWPMAPPHPWEPGRPPRLEFGVGAGVVGGASLCILTSSVSRCRTSPASSEVVVHGQRERGCLLAVCSAQPPATLRG